VAEECVTDHVRPRGEVTADSARPRSGPARKEDTMLGYALTFLIIALVAGLLGFSGIAGTAAWIAQILFVLFLVLFVASLIMGRRRVRP
jgi:uncharacterized membrane protein YtjA (UPF0391 family)